MKNQLLIVAVLSATSIMFMASSSTIRHDSNTLQFQRVLVDNQDNPLDGLHDLCFRIYQEKAGNTALWSEKHYSVNLDKGQCDLMLGQQYPLNLNPECSYWLSIEIDGSGEAQPRYEVAYDEGSKDWLVRGWIIERHMSGGTGYGVMWMEDTLDGTGIKGQSREGFGLWGKVDSVGGIGLYAENASGGTALYVSGLSFFYGQMTANVPQGIAPLIVNSTALNTNLNADLLDGVHSSAFASSTHNHDATYVNEGQANSIASAMILDNTISASDIADNAVGTAEIAPSAVASSEIADGSVASVDIANGTINSDDIADGSIAESDLNITNTPSSNNMLAWNGSGFEWRADQNSGGDITQVGSMTSGAVFANTSADNQWLGLGNDQGKIAFGNASSGLDTIALLNARIGIGTSNPNEKLEINGNLMLRKVDGYYEPNIDFSNDASGYDVRLSLRDSIGNILAVYGMLGIGDSDQPGTLHLFPGDGGAWYAVAIDPINEGIVLGHSAGNLPGVDDVYMFLKSNGNVGIGTMTPDAKLTVKGSGVIFRGKDSSNTTIFEIGEGLDYAEVFPVSQSEVAPGMVMVIDPINKGKLMISTQAYDRKVAGIVAGANGLSSGIKLGSDAEDASRRAVALAGRVYCNVDTQYGDIQPGDLLTTSTTPGYAMVVKDFAQAQGAIIGKAMEGLSGGSKGQILVLVTLQ